MTRSTHPYGSHPSQLVELFLPPGAGPHPVAVVAHGGYWRAQYDRSLMDGLCLDLAAHGVAAWNLEYRRVGSGGGWPDTFLDVAGARGLFGSPRDIAVAIRRRVREEIGLPISIGVAWKPSFQAPERQST